MLWSTGSRAWVLVVAAHGLSCSVAYGNLPRPGIEPMSPALAARFLTTGPPGKFWDSYDEAALLQEIALFHKLTDLVLKLDPDITSLHHEDH